MFLVDWGQSLGENLGLYRATLFKEKPNYWSGFPEYEFDKKKTGLLNRFLAHRSIRYKAAEADLPKVRPISKYVRLPTDARAYYEKARDQLRAARGNIREMENMFLRMRQISSGYVGYVDDETGAKAQFEFDHNPKMEMLLSILESIRGSKSIVFHDFIHTGNMIVRGLKELKIKYVWIRGGIKDPAKLLHTFDNDENCDVMLLNSAGAFGLNLQKAQYGIFYESPVPIIIRKQMERRFIRQHSLHKHVFLYDLIVEGTADEAILQMHKDGRDLFQAIVEDKPAP
jgi:SNF2 family DNA or RNA helicase